MNLKRTIAIFISLILSLSAIAQSGHLKFKGIEISGDYKVFAKQLVEKGFTQIEASDDGVVLIGNFMGRPGTMTIVYPDQQTKNVAAVAAMTEGGENWPVIEKAYDSIVETYTQKYGEPTAVVRQFKDYNFSDDGLKLLYLQKGNCEYNTKWEMEEGVIGITITYVFGKNMICIAYADRQNYSEMQEGILEDI